MATDDLAKMIQKEIMSVWNDTYRLRIEGKELFFNVDVSVAQRFDALNAVTGNFSNFMKVDETTKSYVIGGNKGMARRTIAREGYEGSLMAEPSGFGFIEPREIIK